MTAHGSGALYRDLDRILIRKDEIDARVADLGLELSEAYELCNPLLIGVLTGAFVFMADLVRAMPIPLDVEFMEVSSYGTATESSGVVRILKDLDRAIEGRDILVVEDIVDSGLTLKYLLDVLRRRNPKSVRVVALFNKVKPGRDSVEVDFVGFEIPDEFVVGYGLDAGRKFRNLPFVAVYTPAWDGGADPGKRLL